MTEYEIYDQDEFTDCDYFAKVGYKYYPLIGEFICVFSSLESSLNESISVRINPDWAEDGYMIIEKLSVANKIDLFFKSYLRLIVMVPEKDLFKPKLVEIRDELSRLNTFRNGVAHADWQSLTKDGYVRSKIVVDDLEGYVKFKKIPMTIKLLRFNIKAITRLIDKLPDFSEKITEY